MIKIIVYKNKNNDIYGFKANDHGDPIVCSAVSALTINAVNSIEFFTNEKIICNYDQDGGFLHFEMPNIRNNGQNDEATLLMESMLFGLKSIKNEYKEHIEIIEEV